MIQSYKICADSEYLHCYVKSDHSATQAGPTYARNDTTAQIRAHLKYAQRRADWFVGSN